MRVSLLCIGGKMPDWVEAGVAEYRKRLPQEIQLDIRELPLAKRGKNTDIRRAIAQEGEAMLAAIPRGDKVIALDVKGRSVSTESLSKSLAAWRMEGDNVSILVGGPDGLAAPCLAASSEKWSMSAMTLPHPLVRVMFAEQLYRAWTILANHPYHR